MKQAGIAVAFVLAALAAPLRADIAPYPPTPAAHAWRPLSTHAPELRPLLGPALAALPRRGRLAGVFRAEQQFIGGETAYRLILVLADRSKWRVTLTQRGRGPARATRVEPVP